MVSRKIATAMENGSFIRKMFEEGNRLRAQMGPDRVFDFSLGNPDLEPPAAVLDALRETVHEEGGGRHAYMSNNGYLQTREAVADWLNRSCAPVQMTPDLVCMTVGAAGALNVALKAILDPGDEVIVLAPYFVEYVYYIDNHGGKCVVVPCEEGSFQPDVARIAAAITPRTRAIILNTPNNPTGALYTAETLQAIDALIAAQPNPIVAISDEPYSAIAYDGRTVPATLAHIRNMVMCYSWSKSLSLPGERIGFCAVSPRCEGAAGLAAAFTFCNRILGFVNAPARMQRVVARSLGAQVDVARYETRRNALHAILADCGFKAAKPAGGFYIFMKSPTADDAAFANACAAHQVLLVPGRGFGCPGYVRLCFAVPDKMIANSRASFQAIAREFGLTTGA